MNAVGRSAGGSLAAPRGCVESAGEMFGFAGRVVLEVFRLRVFKFFGEAPRQAGILIVSSTLVIWGLVFISGLSCGIEGAYLLRAQGAPAYAGGSPPGATCASLYHWCSDT
jgi:phospholipid/cholesterol/gamma-HCH transport system permease protein